jgi:prevent-host-death family protein
LWYDRFVKTVGIFEAKAHFSALVDEARNGHTIVITRNGEAVAQMVPMPSRDADARGLWTAFSPRARI